MNRTEMKNSDKPSPTGTSRFHQIAPALALFLTSPFVAEFLLGDFSIDAFGLLFVMAPLYGGGALVVREAARRRGLGWTSMILMAFAYGLFEEGIVIQTLFNPDYLGLHLLDQAHVPVLEIGLWWTSFVLTLHTVWSISVPIAIVEGLFPERRLSPWLGGRGLCIAFLLLCLGGLMTGMGTRGQYHYSASWLQTSAVAILIAAVLFLALRRRPVPTPRKGRVPSAYTVAAFLFFWGLAFMNANKVLSGWTLAWTQLGLDGIAALALLAWSGREGWTELHTLAAGGGALLVYACMGFPQKPLAGSPGITDWIGNAVFALMAVTLLALALRRTLASSGKVR
jgi:hypothetical protein